MPLDIDTVLAWRGRTVYDRDAQKIGTLSEVFLDAGTDRPAYVGIQSGLLGQKSSIVPLDGIQEHEDGLRVPYEKAVVMDAPSLEPDAELSPEETDVLLRHYDVQRERDKPDPFQEGVVRSEEEAHVTGVQEEATQRVRVKKVRVTEEVPVTTQVRKEVVQLETDPPPPGRVESVEDVEP